MAKPKKILDAWLNGKIPGDCNWNDIQRICRWLCDNYGFSFSKGQQGSHWLLQHELLKEHHHIRDFNYEGAFTIVMHKNKVSRPYLRNIVDAYEIIKEINDE